MVVSIDAVRDLAREENLIEIGWIEKNNVISFWKGVGTNYTRINVWCTTGTVGTYMLHPRLGRTQFFRRNCTIDRIQGLMKNPRLHSGSGYYTVEKAVEILTKIEKPKEKDKRSPQSTGSHSTYSSNKENSDPGELDERCEAERQLRRIQKERTSLDEEEKRARKVIDSIEKRQEDERFRLEEEQLKLEEAKRIISEEKARVVKQQAEEYERRERRDTLLSQRRGRNESMGRSVERQRQDRRADRTEDGMEEEELVPRNKIKNRSQSLATTRRLRGTKYHFSLPESLCEDFEMGWSKSLVSVALGNSGFIQIEEPGKGWNFRNVPKGLEKRLTTRSAGQPPPKYTSLGAKGRYFVQYPNGKRQWSGPASLSTYLQGAKRSVRSVAFGKNYNTWFVVHSDGDYEWNGKIPYGLEQVLNAHDHKLKCVSLGGNNEWYLEASTGEAWWNGISETMSDCVENIKDQITFMDFGDEWEWIVRYE